MAQTKIYGLTQIQSQSIDLDKLVSPFISATTGNWDITSGNLDATITGIPNPVNDYDVVNKAYVDSMFATGIVWKQPVRVLSDSNIDITNPPSSIDGVTLSNGDRIGIFNQTTSTEDGVYIYNGSGNALTRADDWAVGEGAANWTFWVQEGTNYADTQWTVTNNSGSDVIGTDDLQIIQIAGQGLYNFQNALTKTGSTVEWGGTLLHDTTIDGSSSYNVAFTNLSEFSFTTSLAQFLYDSSNNYIHSKVQNSNNTSSSSIDVREDYVYLSSSTPGGGTYIRVEDTQIIFSAGNSGGGSGSATLDTDKILIDGASSFTGMQYNNDFHTNWTDRHIVDKQYVDTYNRVTVRVMATGNVDIANPPSIIDDVTLNNGDLILLTLQTTASEDGIYVYNGSGNALTRATYFESGVDVKGLTIYVEEGTTNGQSFFIISNTSTAIIGTDDLSTNTLGGAAAAATYENALTKTGNIVRWGGPLTQDTTVGFNSYKLTFDGTHYNFVEIDDSNDLAAFGLIDYADWNTPYGSYLVTSDSGTKIGVADHGSGAKTELEFTNTNGIKVTDWYSNIGFTYDSDYFNANKTNPRWVPDKDYVDNVAKAIVRVRATGNVDITNAPASIDGVTLNNGDLILLDQQTTASQDGIYVFYGAGNNLARASYFRDGVDVKGLTIFVEEGDTNGQTLFAISNTGSAIIGTDNLDVIVIGGASAQVAVSNGLHNDSGVIKLGGALTENTTLDANSQYDFIIQNMAGFYIVEGEDIQGGEIYLRYDRYDPGWQMGYVDPNTNYSASLQLKSGNTYIRYGSTNQRTFYLQHPSISGAAVIEDNLNSKGMVYAADYSANGTTDDRWIPDWGTVKNYVSNSTNRIYGEIHDISSDTNTITLSGATAGDGKTVQNVVIYVNGERQTEGSSYDYTITDADAGTITFTYTLVGGHTTVVVDYDYM